MYNLILCNHKTYTTTKCEFIFIDLLLFNINIVFEPMLNIKTRYFELNNLNHVNLRN